MRATPARRWRGSPAAGGRRGIAEGADAGDVEVDRRTAVRTRLRGDRPRPAGLRSRRTLKDPVFCPVPGLGITADDIPGGVEVVVGGVGVDAHGDGIEATVAG